MSTLPNRPAINRPIAVLPVTAAQPVAVAATADVALAVEVALPVAVALAVKAALPVAAAQPVLVPALAPALAPVPVPVVEIAQPVLVPAPTPAIEVAVVVPGLRLPTEPARQVVVTPSAGPTTSQGSEQANEWPEDLPVTKAAQKAVVAKTGSAARVPGYRKKRSQRAPQLTPRDIALLRLLLKYKFCTAKLAAEALDMPLASLRRRLPKLQREGLVVSFSSGPTRYLLWRCTEEGAQWTGLDLADPKKIAPTTIAHDLALVDLGIKFEAAGETVISERMIRAVDTRNTVTAGFGVERTAGPGGRRLTTTPTYAVARYAVARSAVPGSNRMHIPDLLLLRDPAGGEPQTVAIEYERSHKAPSFVLENLLAYKHSAHIGAVIYFIPTGNQTVRKLVQQAIADTHTEGFVSVRDYVPSPACGLIQWED